MVREDLVAERVAVAGWGSAGRIGPQPAWVRTPSRLLIPRQPGLASELCWDTKT
ncbi:MAG: hypothetical protein QOE72_2584 [Chloroflexota bacterium]|jgi:hypothetical protein|nr:hypothetical protein [Chloroflexota bacterium]